MLLRKTAWFWKSGLAVISFVLSITVIILVIQGNKRSY